MKLNRQCSSGFSMVEMVFSMVILGVVMIAFVGIFALFQRSSAQSHQYAEAQQNARIAVDFVTDYLRQAGSGTDYVRAQRFIVAAEPYQVAFNADLDNGQTIDGLTALSSIDLAHSPNAVPASGTAIYTPPRAFQSAAETVVLTLDSNSDGVISSSDRGDDSEEPDANLNLYVLKRVTYGFDGASENSVRTANLAVVRGPGAYGTGARPQPLFSYLYDHDDDAATPHRMWGDSNNNGQLESSEIASLGAMTDALLPSIREVRVTVTSEATEYSKKHESTDGHLAVSMQSKVNVRNALRTGSAIYGTVYNDDDADGVFDTGEQGIPNVKVNVVGSSRQVTTNSYGVYNLPIAAGSYTVRETDPPGWASTTSNTVNANVGAGDAVQVNFGDRSGTPMGYIRGMVYDDLDNDAIKDNGEAGIVGVLLSLDSGEQAHTNDAGIYEFYMPVGSHTVVETDPDGYSSTTPNSADADILASNDTVTVDFGDRLPPPSGTLQGIVYNDADQDGVRDGGEGGLSNVTLTVSSGDSTQTNSSGEYTFTLEMGAYSITERDNPGYGSSTVNTYSNIVIAEDTVVTRNFGDFLMDPNSYIEIVVGNTDRALSVGGTDLKEDTKGDVDIVLGTPYSASGNLQVFLNQYKNKSTALSALFKTTPDYRRNAANNITTTSIFDFSADGKPDVLTGTQYNAGNNILIWFDGSSGLLSTTPSKQYISNASTFVLCSKVAEITNDSHADLIVGLKGSPGTGGFQTFRSTGSGNFTSLQHVTTAGPGSVWVLGEVWGIDAADLNGDGKRDVVVGTHNSDYQGYIDVYINGGTGTMTWNSRYLTGGAVNAVKLIEMNEDEGNDIDILAGTSSAANAGKVLFWGNTNGAFGQADTTGYAFPSGVSAMWPSDYVDPSAEVLSLVAARVNPDIFPEVFFGTRKSAVYTGDVYVLESYGTLPSSGRKLNGATVIGEAVTLGLSDFSLDNRTDLVVGARTSATAGKLIVYFYSQ